MLILPLGQANAQTASSGGGTTATIEKDIEVAIGIDTFEKVDFDFSSKVGIGNEPLLKLVLIPQRREIIFKGQKPGKTFQMTLVEFQRFWPAILMFLP